MNECLTIVVALEQAEMLIRWNNDGSNLVCRNMPVLASLISFRFLLVALLQTLSAQLRLGEPQEVAAAAKEAFDRDTPHSTVAGLIRAAAGRNYVPVANHFSASSDDPTRMAEGARALQTSLDACGNLVPFAELLAVTAFRIWRNDAPVAIVARLTSGLDFHERQHAASVVTLARRPSLGARDALDSKFNVHQWHGL